MYKRSGSLYNRIQIVETGETFETSKECARYLGRSEAAVSACLNGKNLTCGGYHLELIPNDSGYDLCGIETGNAVEIAYAPGYFVSDAGIIYGPGSIGRRKPHKLASYTNDKYGHQVVDLYINGKRVHKYVAVLVAEAFIPNPNNYPEVRHMDGNPRNNHVSNLEWGTHADNMKDAQRHGTFHYFTEEEDEMALRALRTPVKAVNIRTGQTYYFASQADAARELGLFQPNIRHVLSGWYKQTGGFRFEYLDKGEFDAGYYY